MYINFRALLNQRIIIEKYWIVFYDYKDNKILKPESI
jgi:hypothetical protein